MTTVSTLRLNLLRACYLLLVVGLALNIWPQILNGAMDRPLMDGAVNAILGGLSLLSVAGLFSPLRMLPLLVFEVTWKLIWTLSVAVPRWQAGTFDAATGEILFACAWVVPFVFIIPWRHVVATYLRRAEPWR